MNQKFFSNKSQLIAILLIGLLGFAVLFFAQRSLNLGSARYETLSSSTASVSEKPLADINPADRKFFTNNINIERKVAPQSYLLTGIDPADRKFLTNNFNNEYEAASPSDVITDIDPADRKFFNGAYGLEFVDFEQAKK